MPDVSIEGMDETSLCIVHKENGLQHRELTNLHLMVLVAVLLGREVEWVDECRHQFL
jgi:hypothetical protein